MAPRGANWSGECGKEGPARCAELATGTHAAKAAKRRDREKSTKGQDPAWVPALGLRTRAVRR